MNVTEQTKTMLKSLVDERFQGNMRQASQFLGLDPSSGILRKWITGERSPSLATISHVYEKLGITLNIPEKTLIDFEFVQKHDAKAGAGASLETTDNVVGFYAFRRDWLTSQRIFAAHAVLLDVIGDSMEPLFKEGDTLLIDKQDKTIRDGKIYIVTLGEELRVKRVFHGINGLILRSENKIYPDVSVTGPDLETFVVHGRVRWCGKVIC